MSKLLLTALTLVLVVAGAAVVFAATDEAPSSATVDLSGPCDETEHANDPACGGAASGVGDDNGARGHSGRGRDHAEDDDGAEDAAGGHDPSAEDISGNCDEAEHAADSECQGVAPATTTPSVGDDAVEGNDDDAVEDNSGPSENSGPGSLSSGHGDESEEEDDDDSSGHGGDDDSSGHGGGDD